MHGQFTSGRDNQQRDARSARLVLVDQSLNGRQKESNSLSSSGLGLSKAVDALLQQFMESGLLHGHHMIKFQVISDGLKKKRIQQILQVRKSHRIRGDRNGERSHRRKRDSSISLTAVLLLSGVVGPGLIGLGLVCSGLVGLRTLVRVSSGLFGRVGATARVLQC